MTEREWLESDDAPAMMAWLTQYDHDWKGLERLPGPEFRPSERRLRLFAVAWWRVLFDHANGVDRHSARRQAEVAERHADDPAEPLGDINIWVYCASASEAARNALLLSNAAPPGSPRCADVLRDTFGTPHRPWCVAEQKLARTLKGYRIFDLDWLTADVVALAHAAYDGRDRVCPKCDSWGIDTLHDESTGRTDHVTCPRCHGTGRIDDGTLDPLRLSVLADALEEVGADADIVAELRADRPRYRGFWPVDLLLGKQ